jgi:hypothetical protein
MSRRCFIKIDPLLDEDEKTLQLADDLGLDIDVVTGKLIRLWSWAFGHAEDGDLSSLTPRQFALVMRLPGSTGEQLVKSLRECGFMDEWQLHSWDDWGGTLAAQRREEAARQATLREKSRVCHSDITQKYSRAKRVELRVKSEEQDQEQDQELLPDESGVCAPTFDDFWNVYPRKIEKTKAERVWRTRIRDGTDPEDMVIAAQFYAGHCRADPSHAKYPATFLGPDRHFEEWLHGVPLAAGSGNRNVSAADLLAAADACDFMEGECDDEN